MAGVVVTKESNNPESKNKNGPEQRVPSPVALAVVGSDVTSDWFELKSILPTVFIYTSRSPLPLLSAQQGPTPPVQPRSSLTKPHPSRVRVTLRGIDKYQEGGICQSGESSPHPFYQCDNGGHLVGISQFVKPL